MVEKLELRLGIYVITLLLLNTVILAQEMPYRQLSTKDYEDKVAGGWVGQAIGVLYGQWTEGKWQGKHCIRKQC